MIESKSTVPPKADAEIEQKMREVFEHVKATAVKILESGEEVRPFFFFHMGNQIGQTPSPMGQNYGSADIARQRTYEMLQMLKQKYTWVVSITEMWMSTKTVDSAEKAKELLQAEDFVRPSEDPDRKEVLCASLVGKGNPEMWTMSFTRKQEEGKITVAHGEWEKIDMQTPAGSIFGDQPP